MSKKERPILFSAPMVRAILDGRKTQTRRVVKFPHPPEGWHVNNCPYGIVGDRLWVRESLTHITNDPVHAQPCDVHCYTASIPHGMSSANPYEPNYLFPNDGLPVLQPKNTPAIFMPRWASRLTLEIVDVRVERLQEISAKDILAEGAVARAHDDQFGHNPVSAFDGKCYLDLRSLWAHGWDSINAKRGYGWDKNPWVWVIEFRKLSGENPV